MRNLLFMITLFATPFFANAQAEVGIIEMQKRQIDDAIVKRNSLLDELKFPKSGDDSDLMILTQVNLNELSVIYALDTVNNLISILNKVDNSNDRLRIQKSIDNIKDSLGNTCHAQKIQMRNFIPLVRNKKIANLLEIQKENLNNACHVVSGGIFVDGKYHAVY